MGPPGSEAELREFLERTPVGLRWVGPDGRILWANRADQEIVGCAESECIGRHIDEFLFEPGTAAELLDRIAHGETIRSYQARIRTKGGELKQVLIDGGGFFHANQLVNIRLVTQDVTGLIQREQSARHLAEATSHLKDEFLALLSHELRTPLGAILVWLGLLQQAGFDPAGSARALEIIERSARSLERIIEDLLHASRIAAGGLTLHTQLLDLRTVLQAAVDVAAGDAALKGLSFAFTQGPTPVWVRGDAGRLQQAVSNLLANAIKFTPAGGSVKVTLETADLQARLSVVDDGEGMSQAFLPLAFERFRQQDSTSTRAHHGLGLGLYVVRHVIGHHGGFVSAESRGPGHGSTFTVLLPLATEPATESALPSPGDPLEYGPRPPGGLTVLIVDDEEDARDALRIILEQTGMTVATAASAPEAFSLLQTLKPDILLSDIAMPEEDGLSLIRRVRLLPPDGGGLTPAAALSAYAAAGDRKRSLLAGFQHHIPKPVDPSHIVAVIASMARNRLGPHG